MENEDDYRTADSGDEESLSYSAGDDDYLPEDEQVDDFGEGRCPQENYILLKEEEIAKLQQDCISEVSTVLSISKSNACLLLPHFHWSVEDLQDEWFSDEDKVRDKAGLLKKPIVEHNASQNLTTTCEICFEEYYYSLNASSRSNSILTRQVMVLVGISYTHLQLFE
ncbi:putative E3 ubiquitin ligase RBR family [Rosa chinensis]|uniref:Putative E3 ubiquitin ligase RBR family n=1 Tax=Rosa chinensis TaxID=74649 RepID=A0A2P6PYE9_ROSCH|nr:putative E3 ubiquitin ligase RBR family [Rosa chinensis]